MIKDFKVGDVFKVNLPINDGKRYFIIGPRVSASDDSYVYAFSHFSERPTELPVYKKHGCLTATKYALLSFLEDCEYVFTLIEAGKNDNLFDIDDL